MTVTFTLQNKQIKVLYGNLKKKTSFNRTSLPKDIKAIDKYDLHPSSTFHLHIQMYYYKMQIYQILQNADSSNGTNLTLSNLTFWYYTCKDISNKMNFVCTEERL